MLSIFATTNQIPLIKEIIQSEYRLDELVEVFDMMAIRPTSSSSSLIINNQGIRQPIDWQNERPPYLLQSNLPFEKNILLGLIFHLLGNNERAWEYIKEYEAIAMDISMNIRLQFNYQIQKSEVAIIPSDDKFEAYRSCHNAAILQHYGYIEPQANFEEVVAFYQKALDNAAQDEYFAFTTKHFSTLCLDANQLSEAEKLLAQALEKNISEEAKYSLKAVLANVWMKQLTIPYDTNLLEKLKNTLWETVQYFEKNNRNTEAGLQYLDAAHIANISESFSEALGYINKAIGFFRTEQLDQLLGNAQLSKGRLLYTWSQQDNPQFYKPAVQAYQEALKVFRQDVTPDVFADIHHNLAVLYSEMPSEPKKRSIWAGIATSSFQEALDFYKKDTYPYEYGRICNNYGNAMTKFPQALHSDNYEKALFYYQEALDVRTSNYPYERAITLLNYLEASWNVGNDENSFNQERYQDMVKKANEVLELVDKADMITEAKKHLQLLEELEKAVAV